MILYKVVAKIYYYWKDECNSGFYQHDYYFQEKRHAQDFLDSLSSHPYWIDINNEKNYVFPSAYAMPKATLIELKTED